MADLDIAIAGRNYRVACADGEEGNLTRAASLLAEEAETLREQFGGRFASLPESRVLLMASLMLGDRFRATLDAAAAAPEPAPAAAAAAAQAGFFDDPVMAAKVAALEAELAEAREGEAAALAALEDAAARVRTLAAEIREDEEDEEDEAGDEEEIDGGDDGAETLAAVEVEFDEALDEDDLDDLETDLDADDDDDD
ncbi:MAG: cell division protein ZapA, partial [Pseudomonadota bacterium]|nr:cell division protein ZapA [Pseudomonadota bacterium]